MSNDPDLSAFYPKNKREREVARAAYERALFTGTPYPASIRRTKAINAYPAPTVTRPRVKLANGVEYRVVDGRIEYRYPDDESFRQMRDGYDATYKAVADLLANPTETVEADE